MIDKFDSVEEMEKSYHNLEKEFTKKCQELSELKKELSKEKIQETKEENIPEEEVKEEVVLIQENEEELEGPEEKVPETVFDLNFRAKAGKFLMENEEARPYCKEISKLLIKDKSLLSCSDPFMVAYAMVLKDLNKKVKSEEDNSKEEKVNDVMVVKKPSIPVISRGIVGMAPTKTSPKFRTLEDARDELINRYFG